MTSYDRQATWQNPRVLGLLFLVFLVGAAAGGVVMMVAHTHNYKASAAKNPSVSLPTDKKEITLQHFKKELDLTPAQAQQIDVILDDFLKYMQVLQDQMDDTRATGKQRILRVLNESQKAKFEKMMTGLGDKPSTPSNPQ